MHLDIEIKHIKRKYEDDPMAIGWMKYYPYHLDPSYDDENGNPYNYGVEEDDDDEDRALPCRLHPAPAVKSGAEPGEAQKEGDVNQDRRSTDRSDTK